MGEYEEMIGELAQRYAAWYAPVEDLRQEGRLAVLEAAERYDSSFGCSPATWAWHCIRSRMLHYRRDQRRLSVPLSLEALEESGVEWEVKAGAIVPDISTGCIDRVFVKDLLARLILRHRVALLLR